MRSATASSKSAPLMSEKRAPRWLVGAIKLTLAAAILTFLVWQAQQHDSFARVIHEPKRWWLLAAGFAFTFASVVVSIVRWYMLVQALGLSFRVSDAFRLGFLGYLLNFVSLGVVGGDLFKAVFIAREQPGKRTEAVATVVVDRAVGLYGLLFVASCAFLVLSARQVINSDVVRTMFTITLVLTIVGTAALGVLLLGRSQQDRARRIATMPYVGPTIARLLAALTAYRTHRSLLLASIVFSIAIHSLLILAFTSIALGLPVGAPTLGEHSVIVPMSLVGAAIPATPNGLGTLEMGIETLYHLVPLPPGPASGDGTVVAFVYRLATMLVAAVGLFYYLAQRSKVDALLQEAEATAEA